MGVGEFSIIIIMVLVALGVFLILRKFWTWYWKIDEGISLLRNIDKKLDKLDAIAGNSGKAIDQG